MMGQSAKTEPMFYYLRLEDQIPEHHLMRQIHRHIDLGFVRERLAPFYKEGGRPSIDPEVLIRMMLVGYLYGIASDRKLVEEVRMHMAYRWFTGLGLDHDVPDHSTVSKNRHGRFRQSKIFREVFDEIVTRCIGEGLVEGKHVSVDGTQILADADRRSLRPKDELAQVAKLSWGLEEYLTEVEKQNPADEEPPIDDPVESGRPTMKEEENPDVSTTDPDASLCKKHGGPAKLSYFSNYLMDNKSRVILGVEATPGRFSHEALAARAMIRRLKKWKIKPKSVGADKAYGSGHFLAWVWKQKIRPHIPLIEHQREGIFTKDQFQYDPEIDTYTCPQGKSLSFRGKENTSQSYVYSASPKRCAGCPVKAACTRGQYRVVRISWYEDAREKTKALVHTQAYKRSHKHRKRIEGLFAELKNAMRFRRVRLRRLWNVSEQFLLAATVQNIKRLVKFLALRSPPIGLQSAPA